MVLFVDPAVWFCLHRMPYFSIISVHSLLSQWCNIMSQRINYLDSVFYYPHCGKRLVFDLQCQVFIFVFTVSNVKSSTWKLLRGVIAATITSVVPCSGALRDHGKCGIDGGGGSDIDIGVHVLTAGVYLLALEC